MNGVLIVDKPAGPTSHDVVARTRHAIGVSRVGHTGTLDPLASGVLPLVVGRATRLAQFLTADEKEYVAGVRLGYATPTYDAEDRMVRDADRGSIRLDPPARTASVPEEAFREVIREFRGTYPQIPPPFSAKKIKGTPAYLLARRRREVEVEPVQVSVRMLDVLEYGEGLATLRVICSSGFYVRSLAHDIGQRLGCGAHLEFLRRTRAGEFTLAQSVPLDAIEADGAAALARMVPMTDLLPGLPHVVVNERGARRAAHGNALAPEDLSDAGLPAPRPGPIRVLSAGGALLAIGEPTAGGVLHPVVVLV
jgi:tRNA pseudouridine55 synthase